MRKKIITMAVTLLLLGLLSAVEQMAVKRLTGDAMARTQEILLLLAQNQTARGLERAHEMDAWWDEEAPRVETLINHEATDDVRFTLSRLVAALEMGDRDGAFVYARELEGGIEHVLERQTLSWQNLLYTDVFTKNCTCGYRGGRSAYHTPSGRETFRPNASSPRNRPAYRRYAYQSARRAAGESKYRA